MGRGGWFHCNDKQNHPLELLELEFCNILLRGSAFSWRVDTQQLSGEHSASSWNEILYLPFIS